MKSGLPEREIFHTLAALLCSAPDTWGNATGIMAATMLRKAADCPEAPPEVADRWRQIADTVRAWAEQVAATAPAVDPFFSELLEAESDARAAAARYDAALAAYRESQTPTLPPDLEAERQALAEADAIAPPPVLEPDEEGQGPEFSDQFTEAARATPRVTFEP